MALLRLASDASVLPADVPEECLSIVRMSDHVGIRELSEVLAVRGVDAVIHLAACFIGEHTGDDVPRLIESNITFGAYLLEAMRETGCNRLINTGTSWQHWRNDNYEPANLYSATKQAFEDIVDYYVSAAGFGCITLALPDTYGPSDKRAKLIPTLLKRKLDGQPMPLSPGRQLLDLVHIDDVTAGYVAALDRLSDHAEGRHERFSLFPEHPVSLRDLIAAFEKAQGVSLNIEWGARPYRSREVMRPWRGQRLPGWSAGIGLAQGLAGL